MPALCWCRPSSLLSLPSVDAQRGLSALLRLYPSPMLNKPRAQIGHRHLRPSPCGLPHVVVKLQRRRAERRSVETAAHGRNRRRVAKLFRNGCACAHRLTNDIASRRLTLRSKRRILNYSF